MVSDLLLVDACLWFLILLLADVCHDSVLTVVYISFLHSLYVILMSFTMSFTMTLPMDCLPYYPPLTFSIPVPNLPSYFSFSDVLHILNVDLGSCPR